MAGVLIYTSAPDSEGTLGGLCALGEPKKLGRHLHQALGQDGLCASDPLCAEHHAGQRRHAARGVVPRLLLPAGNLLRAGQQVPGPLGAGEDPRAGRPGLLRVRHMDTAHTLIAEAATKLACEMPAAYVEALACAIQSGPVTKAQAVQGIPHLHYRSLAGGVRRPVAEPGSRPCRRRRWPWRCARRCTPSRSTGRPRWWNSSGPAPPAKAHPFRRTEQAILQVLDSAQAADHAGQLRRLPDSERLRGAGPGGSPGRADQRHRGDAGQARRRERVQHAAGAGRRRGRLARRSTTGRRRSGARTTTASSASCTSSAPWPMAAGCSCRRPT